MDKMNDKIVYTPGPSEVRENVRLKRAEKTTNPDVDLDFCEFYKNTCDKMAKILKTKNDVYILSGEGMLGLEAACASLTENGDRVLVIDNGIFGKGFDDFVKMYGGEVVYFSDDYNKEIDVDKLEKFLEKDHDFKYATVVHCDTPTGVLNDLSKICPLLKKYNILTVVDSVAAMVGENIEVDNWQLDIVCGGSQKAISAPTGLTMVSVSEDAKNAMKNRKTPIIGFYCNLTIWENYYRDKWFPYTMPISDIYGLKAAMDNIAADKDLIKRHARIANATRKAIEAFGLKLHLESGFSDTVTVFDVPEGMTADDILERMREKHGIMLAGSFGELAGKVIRIGHMGASANVGDMLEVMSGLEETLRYLGWKSENSLLGVFHTEL